MLLKRISTPSTLDSSTLPSKIGFFSPLIGVGINDGYGYAAIKLIQAWQRLKIPVWTSDPDAPVIFNMGQPTFYERIEGKLNIGYTAWESTEIPKSWIVNMNKMDEIWTMCEEMKLRFEDVLSVPVRVLNHGIDREEWPIVRRRQNGPIKFLHVGGHAPRKGALIAYECFKDLFGDSTDVSLTLKGYYFEDKKIQNGNVHVMTGKLEHKEMIQLYYDHDAMVYPCKGEGFGFVPFQAASSGMPTAVTNWSGPCDYMERCFPIRSWSMSECNYEPHLGLWAEPHIEDVEKWFKVFAEYPEQMFQMAHAKASRNEQYWTWDNQAKLALEYMIENLN